jgi:RNA polymerase sigma-70 factor, ECF subfamily
MACEREVMESVGRLPLESPSGRDVVPQLIEQAHAGSNTALGQLTELYRRYLQVLTARKLPRELQAKVSPSDVVQDTLVEACQDFVAFAGQTRFELRAWLRRMLVNNLADQARHYQETAKRQVSREVRLQNGGEDDSRADNIGLACWDTPSAQAMHHEATDLVERVLAELPDTYRQVVLLRSRDRLSFPAIGQKMERSADAARKLWATAILRLQQRLETL